MRLFLRTVNYIFDKVIKALLLLFFLALFDVIYFEQYEAVELEGTRWCFYAEYDDMDSFDSTQRSGTSFISMKGSKVQVYKHCDTIHE